MRPSRKSRQRPTLPHSYPCSTIGGNRLNFRVRNGNGCDPAPMTTGESGCGPDVGSTGSTQSSDPRGSTSSAGSGGLTAGGGGESPLEPLEPWNSGTSGTLKRMSKNGAEPGHTPGCAHNTP